MQKEDLSITSLGDPLSCAIFLPDSSGTFPALVVCHGALAYKELYYGVCEHLAECGVAALAVDMHGHGQSAGQRFHVDMREWVADVQAAVAYLAKHPRIDPLRIGAWGHSSGGTAILEAAPIERQLKVLVTLDATVRNSLSFIETLGFQILILAGRAYKLFTRKDLRLDVGSLLQGTHIASDPQVEQKLRTDPRLAEAPTVFPMPGAAECFFVDTIKRVSKISAATLVLWGEDDELDPPETAHMLYDALTCKKQLQIIPGNGHMGNLDRNKAQVLAFSADWALENLV